MFSQQFYFRNIEANTGFIIYSLTTIRYFETSSEVQKLNSSFHLLLGFLPTLFPMGASRLLWMPKLHFRTHKSSPLVPILSQMNPFHIFKPISLRTGRIVFTHLSLGLLEWSLSFRFSHQSVLFLISHTFYVSDPSNPP
jgi:hypothetical protein